MVSLRDQIKRRQQGLDNGKEVLGGVIMGYIDNPLFFCNDININIR